MYFSRSQFHFEFWHEPHRRGQGPESMFQIRRLRIAQQSGLLGDNLQHVLLRWGPIFEVEMLNVELEVIKWLATLKQLKSLEIMFAV